MKKVYCIEEWVRESERVRDGGFWGNIECPWKLGMTDTIQEFDDEEEFKNYLKSILDDSGVVGRVFIKEVSDDYESYHWDAESPRHYKRNGDLEY